VITRRRKHWGWGFEDQQPSPGEARASAAALAAHLEMTLGDFEDPVSLQALELPAPRLDAPPSLAEICFDDVHTRASHALGKSYVDVVRGFRGRFEEAPDLVARPREEADVERLLEWCSSEGVAAIPFGGGTSVVGGVTPDVGPHYNGVVSIDLGGLDRVLEVDAVSRCAIFRSRLSSRLWAAGSPPGQPAISRRYGLTSRTSSSPSARSRRSVCGSRDGCPDRVRE
jgi:alkyldihydroxyacetonephosphate synthase